MVGLKITSTLDQQVVIGRNGTACHAPHLAAILGLDLRQGLSAVRDHHTLLWWHTALAQAATVFMWMCLC